MLLVFMFLAAQLIGLIIVRQYIAVENVEAINPETGETVIVTGLNYGALPFNMERPPINGTESFIYILGAILFGTLIFFLIIKWKKRVLWKFWFYFAVVLCLSIALSPFITTVPAFVLSMIAGYYKVFKPKMMMHNITELFIYGGLAAIFVPVMNLASALLLLLAISIYDMIAVWQSKHMIKLAKFQTESKVFAGLMIQYKRAKSAKHIKTMKLKKSKISTAILGGGDIGFPIIFAGVIMKGLLIQNPVWGFYRVLTIPLMASAALMFLFWKAEKGKFYPAMPFISIGCLIGWLLTLI